VSGLDDSATKEMESWSLDSSVSSRESEDLAIASLPETDYEANIHPVSNLEECFVDITHVITCLYDFSISIQNPAPRDRLQKCSTINVSHYEFWDIMHVSHKFQSADDALINRLGKANTRRRQLLKYHQKHHKTIAGPPVLFLPQTNQPSLSAREDDGISDGKDDVGMEAEAKVHVQEDSEHLGYVTEEKPETIFTGRQTQTTVSTYVPRTRDPDLIESRSEADQSEADQSRTSFATSIGGNQSIPVPSPPDEENSLNGEPFQCNFCFCIIKIDNRRSWM